MTLEGAMYIKLYGEIFGGIPKMLVFCNFLKILTVQTNLFTLNYRAFRTPVTLLTKLIREIFNFLYLPKLYIGFN